MKKMVAFVILSLSLQGGFVVADGIKDNRLQIESGRVEQDTNKDQMGQNPLVSDLFGADEVEKIDDRRELIDGRLGRLQESLFVSEVDAKAKDKTGSLFTSEEVAKEHLLPRTPSNQLESLDTTLIYSGLCLLVFGGAAYVTHRMSKE